VILIGATTENPYFEVNKALVSRSRIFQLKPLTQDDLFAVARQALADPERGYGKLNVQLDDDALAHLVDVANGDARGVLNALELAVETTEPETPPPGTEDATRNTQYASARSLPVGRLHITRAIAEESIQRRAVLYDKEGDVHYDTISAFIKSLRGSDPDAALYWMARMVYAGEEPRFIFRRMIVFAGEDVGLADPNALRVVMAASQAFEYVGLPEGRFHLAEAALYLATAPKSNSGMAFFDALEAVEKEQEADVPAHLRDGNRDKEGFGHGEGYLYPHAYRDHWVAQQYLPDALQGRVFYQPSSLGYEAKVKGEVERRREAQLAAMMEGGEGFGAVETLTFTGAAARGDRDHWLQRAISGAGERLARLRDQVLDAVRLQRHGLVLDINAGSGLLTWETARRAPEGGVWSLAATAAEADALREIANRMAQVERPVVLQGALTELPELLALRGEGDVRFDAIVGRGTLALARKMDHGDSAKPPCGTEDTEIGEKLRAPGVSPQLVLLARLTMSLLRPGGVVSLAEPVPRHAQRLYALVDLASLGDMLAEKVRAAEEAIYADPDDPLVNWAEEDLRAAFAAVGLADVAVESQERLAETRITPAMLSRWFGAAGRNDRPSYGQRLAAFLSADELAAVQALYERTLTGATVSWRSVTAYVVARKP
jgi:putative ATPase